MARHEIIANNHGQDLTPLMGSSFLLSVVIIRYEVFNTGFEKIGTSCSYIGEEKFVVRLFEL